MRQFSRFTHERTSSSKDSRFGHFRKLKSKHSANSFIVVGPQNQGYQGALAVQFQPLNWQRREVQDCFPSPQQPTTEKSHFTTIISNAPRMHLDNNVIELSDTPQPQINDEIYADLPLIPIFNTDKKHYTPTFVLPNSNIREEQCLKNFNNKIIQSHKIIPSQQIMEPRPKIKHLYCGVCKQSFEQYLGHIKGKSHLDRSNKSPFNNLIKSLELNMNIGQGKKEREKQWKKIKALQERARKKDQESKNKSQQEKGHSQKGDDKNKIDKNCKEDKKTKMDVQLAPVKVEYLQKQKQSSSSSSSSSSSQSSSSTEKKGRKNISKKDKSSSAKKKKQPKQTIKKVKQPSSRSKQQKFRSREKPEKKTQTKQKKQSSDENNKQIKKKRGRPSKKDLERRRIQQERQYIRKKGKQE